MRGGGSMTDIVIRPTMKRIKAGYLLIAILVAAGLIAEHIFAPDKPWWWAAIGAVLFLWPLSKHIQRRGAGRLTMSADRLRFESGVLSKSTRTVQLLKVQDVRIKQSFFQRMWNIGDLSIASAGDPELFQIDNIDRPRAVSEKIVDRCQFVKSQLPAESPAMPADTPPEAPRG